MARAYRMDIKQVWEVNREDHGVIDAPTTYREAVATKRQHIEDYHTPVHYTFTQEPGRTLCGIPPAGKKTIDVHDAPATNGCRNCERVIDSHDFSD